MGDFDKIISETIIQIIKAVKCLNNTIHKLDLIQTCVRNSKQRPLSLEGDRHINK